MPETWKEISNRKKAEQASRVPTQWIFNSQTTSSIKDVPRSCGILSKEELDITENYDATSLAESIAARKLKCVDVTLAFCKVRPSLPRKITSLLWTLESCNCPSIGNQFASFPELTVLNLLQTNCLTEIFFDDALARATKLDEHLAAGKPLLGPLHGVPISLKDSFNVAGYDASIGIAALALSPVKENAPLVNILLAAGAVLYCKTNVPQTLLALDSHNNVFGRTINPQNPQLTAGGSTGGEGALIALRGSILGVGTDVGGSIRIPAMCNGIYGFKPSCQRIPYYGQQSGTLPAFSKLSMASSAGPLATSLRDCELFLRTVASSRPWELDPDVVPGYWDFQGDCNPLRFTVGVVHTDGVSEPLPPIKKVINEVASILRRAGANVLDLDITHVFSKCQSLANATLGINDGNATFDLLEKTGEPLSPWLSGKMGRRAPRTVEQARSIQESRERVQREFLKVWKAEKGDAIDVLICPVAPHPTPPIDRWVGVGYTSSFVLLDYPAGVSHSTASAFNHATIKPLTALSKLQVLPIRKCNRADIVEEASTSPPLTSWDGATRKLCKSQLSLDQSPSPGGRGRTNLPVCI